jgi:hypothetical protein
MKYNKLTRRMFLQGSGGALVAIPFLESLLPSTAWGQTSQAPKRFLSIVSNLDIGHNSNWYPNASGTNTYNIPQPNRILPGINGQQDIRWQPLREFAPTGSSPLATIWGSSVSPYLESMNILRSLDFADRRGHDTCRVLGGLGFTMTGEWTRLAKIPTIDHIINNKIGDGRPLIFAGGTGNDWISLAPDSKVGSIRGTWSGWWLQDMYDSIFRHGTYPDVSTGSTPSGTRRDILSRVLGDFSRLMNSRNISSADRTTLSNAMDKMSDVQRGLSSVYAAQCSHKNLVTTAGLSVGGAHNTAANGKALADLITAAFMCDATRVITVGMEIFQDPYLGEIFDHQTTSHTPFAVVAANGKYEWQIMGERHAFLTRNFIAPLLQNLSSAIDPVNGKSLLYNSLVFNSVESGQVHGWGSSPVALFGNAGGALSTGNYIDYADRAMGGAFEGADLFNKIPGDAQFSNNWRGVSYNRLLVTFMQAMGLQPSDYEKDSINQQFFNRTDIGQMNMNLTSIGGYGYPLVGDLDPRNENKVDLAFYDLKQFRNKLPMP